MSKKTYTFLLLCAALSQITYRTYWVNFMDAVSRPVLHFSDYMIVTEEFRSLGLLLSLCIFFGALFFFRSPGLNQKISDNKFWHFGFLGILFFLSATVIYANPQGRFPWNKHANYIELEVRSRKPDLYKKLEHTPDLVLLGSSVSFLVPMNYFEEKWDIQAFNMSVNGGGPVDFVNLINIIKKTSPDSKMPAIIMVEILSPSLSFNNLEQTPIEYIPEMSSISQQISAIWKTISSTFRFNSLSDSLFTLFIVDKGRWDIVTTLTGNGTMIKNEEDVKDKQYRKSVEKDAVLMDELQSCESLDGTGKLALEKLVQLSHEYKFSLVVYRTPVNQDFYTFSNFKPSKYSGCAQKFDQYIEGIAAQNPNMFFKDLSQYSPIAAGGKEIYRDTHHLTTRGNILLLDALDNEIESAIQWARKNR